MQPSNHPEAVVTPAELEQAAAIIRRGGIVAFPTETYYGLAVDPFNREALSRLFALKRRAPDKPILCLVPDREHLFSLADSIPPSYEPLMEAFWPGPLTLIFTAREEVPVSLTGYSGTVGVRLSSHPVAARLAQIYGGAITATSANFSGHPAAVNAAEVGAQLGPDVDYILDGGETPGGAGSTLVGVENEQLVLRRPGVITRQELNDVLGPERIIAGPEEGN
ncbi:L-threonylcarbamoyladenylate synthase [Desulfurivibrio alkaliphilus]|uniref:L-threonylcarbamoyladenylate synthase n=1 Tax=Desulfurivibrio alkaliphilus (strain DSM 19089 / UNIQEM U267 / AHT2) TaxID=589865 RepID=D6Z3B6_DESAT|nr:L-threonylcarbamoyladenylate synthase [Desulfurivibrio alkaliphilus]ADH86041.1 Sua5/YciO/YrdC/YwlC family protein [Desulfurivibrio alkaliphilus AHT 2]